MLIAGKSFEPIKKSLSCVVAKSYAIAQLCMLSSY